MPGAKKYISSAIVIISVTGVILTGSITILSKKTHPSDSVTTDRELKKKDKITNINLKMDFNGFKTVLEAEKCVEVSPPFKIINAAEASGGKCISIKDGAGNPPEVSGKAVYYFSVPTDGLYRVWGRRWWKDSCGNSLTFLITGTGSAYIKKEKRGGTSDASQPHIFGEDPSYNPDINIPWKWTQGPLYYFEKGEFQLIIKNREDGVKLDQILFVEHKKAGPQYKPADIE